MVTAYDVATRAGVSIGTVSRYLTGNGYVSDKTRRRIADAVAELGFIPNRAAASLVTKKTGLWGFVVSDLRNPFTAEIASAITEFAHEAGYGVVLADSMGDPDRAIDTVQRLRGHDVDGLIITPPESPALLDLLTAAAQSQPIVGIGMRTDPLAFDLVTSDTRGGAARAVSYLVGLGHRRIAYLGSDRQASGRYLGYQDALAEHGVPPDPAIVLHGSLDREFGHRAAETLLLGDRPPTAVFCANDAVALGVLQGAGRLGIRVPDDISVVGFDDVDLAGHSTPPLTTVGQPMREMGRAAVELLLGRLRDSHPLPPTEIKLATVLVERESCAPPRSSHPLPTDRS